MHWERRLLKARRRNQGGGRNAVLLPDPDTLTEHDQMRFIEMVRRSNREV
jgi:hypothetical protein